MNKEDYIDKIELILNTSGKYITNKEKDMILDYIEYLKSKGNIVEDKNIELVIENEKLHSIIKEVREYMNNLRWFEMVSNDVDMTLYASTKDFWHDISGILDKVGEE